MVAAPKPLEASHSFSLFCSSGSKAPGDLDAGQGKHLFLSRLDYAPTFSYPAYFLLNFCALYCSYVSDQSRRTNVLSVFLPLPLSGLHPNSSYVQQGEGKRILFYRMSGGWGEVYIVSVTLPPPYWPQHFLPFLLTALSSSLGGKIGTAHR